MVFQVLLVWGELGNLLICLLVHGLALREHEGHLQTKAGPELILTLLKILEDSVCVDCVIIWVLYSPSQAYTSSTPPSPRECSWSLYPASLSAYPRSCCPLPSRPYRKCWGLEYFLFPTLFAILDMIFPPRPFKSIFAWSLLKSTWNKRVVAELEFDKSKPGSESRWSWRPPLLRLALFLSHRSALPGEGHYYFKFSTNTHKNIHPH